MTSFESVSVQNLAITTSLVYMYIHRTHVCTYRHSMVFEGYGLVDAIYICPVQFNARCLVKNWDMSEDIMYMY